jgi:hypothetical protein
VRAAGGPLPPADAALASFIGDANLLEGVLADGVVKTTLGPLR